MRTPDPVLRERLVQTLRAQPRRSTSELAATLGVTPQTVRRLLDELPPGTILAAGQSRRTRYALRRPLRGTVESLPLYAVDAQGHAERISTLALVQPSGSLLPLQGTDWAVPAQSKDGWWDGLPYPICAVRPQGYLGRQLARAEHSNLGVSENPEEWNDDDIVWVLSRRGADVSGNLILGDAAYRLWLEDKVRDAAPLRADELPDAYAQRATQAVALAGGGSSAAGEFPKFTAVRELEGSTTPHVLVKFSGAAGSAAEQRWGDLLVCEHRALECAARLPGASAARSRILMHANRVFIEVERFDRVGRHGRLSLCGLDAIQADFIGARSSDWPQLASRLNELGLVDAAGLAAVAHLWWYGRLIANTDMHLGNLSFRIETRTLRVAPTYDMLPMAYAPLAGGEVPPREFLPALPLPSERAVWLSACTVAVDFWTAAAADVRIGAAFRSTCRANAARLRTIAERV